MIVEFWSQPRAEGGRIHVAAPIATDDRDPVPRIGEKVRVGGVRYWVRDVEHFDPREVPSDRPLVRLYVEAIVLVPVPEVRR